MAMKIKQAFLHILDNKQGLLLVPTKAIDEKVGDSYRFLKKSFDKMRKNSLGKPAIFKEESEIKVALDSYLENEKTFQWLATEIANKRFQFKELVGLKKMSDLFLCEVELSKVDYVMGLEVDCGEEMVHQVNQREDGIQNNLINYRGVIPKNASPKNAIFFMIEKETGQLTVLESSLSDEDGNEISSYVDQILECETKWSIQEGVEKSKEVVQSVVEKYDLDAISVVPIIEKMIEETVNSGENLDFEEISEQVFGDYPEVKVAYQEEMKALGIDEPILNQKQVKLTPKKTQKIKTTLGIEVTIPIEYCGNPDYVRVSNLPNGEIALELRNLGAIQTV